NTLDFLGGPQTQDCKSTPLEATSGINPQVPQAMLQKSLLTPVVVRKVQLKALTQVDFLTVDSVQSGVAGAGSVESSQAKDLRTSGFQVVSLRSGSPHKDASLPEDFHGLRRSELLSSKTSLSEISSSQKPITGDFNQTSGFGPTLKALDSRQACGLPSGTSVVVSSPKVLLKSDTVPQQRIPNKQCIGLPLSTTGGSTHQIQPIDSESFQFLQHLETWETNSASIQRMQQAPITGTPKPTKKQLGSLSKSQTSEMQKQTILARSLSSPQALDSGAPHVPVQNEVYARAHALARSRLEKSKQHLLGHICDVVTVISTRDESKMQARKKQRISHLLKPALLELFLQALKGMEAFCADVRLRDTDDVSQSLRAQWEVCGTAAERSVHLEALRRITESLGPAESLPPYSTHQTKSAGAGQHYTISASDLRSSQDSRKDCVLLRDQVQSEDPSLVQSQSSKVEKQQTPERTVIHPCTAQDEKVTGREAQSRMKSLETGVELLESPDSHIQLISDQLEHLRQKPLNIRNFVLVDSKYFHEELKLLDERITKEPFQLNERDGSISDIQAHFLHHDLPKCLEQQRQRLKQFQTTLVAIEELLSYLQQINNEISGTDCSLSSVTASQNLQQAMEVSVQVDRRLEEAGLRILLEDKACSCQEMVSALAQRTEVFETRLAGGLTPEKVQRARKMGEQVDRAFGRKLMVIQVNLREVQGALEQHGLKEPTLPALQHRLRFLNDMESKLSILGSEIHELRDACTEINSPDTSLRELQTQWENALRAVTESREHCVSLGELLKRFQSCRNALGTTLQRAEQTITDQASYMSKENLQILISKVSCIKSDLSGLGDSVEDFRSVCRQLQSLMRRMPVCADSPFESEADALMDRWLDVTEKTDCYLDNLQAGFSRWEKLLLLAGEVECWGIQKLTTLAQSNPFQTEADVSNLQDELKIQQENIDHFHRRSSEIQELLQTQEFPLELQVIESQLRKKMIDVQDLFSEAKDVFRQLEAAKIHIASEIANHKSIIQTITFNLSTYKPEKVLQGLSDQLQAEDAHVDAIMKQGDLLVGVAGLEGLQTLVKDAAQLKKSISAVRELVIEQAENPQMIREAKRIKVPIQEAVVAFESESCGKTDEESQKNKMPDHLPEASELPLIGDSQCCKDNLRAVIPEETLIEAQITSGPALNDLSHVNVKNMVPKEIESVKESCLSHTKKQEVETMSPNSELLFILESGPQEEERTHPLPCGSPNLHCNVVLDSNFLKPVQNSPYQTVFASPTHWDAGSVCTGILDTCTVQKISPVHPSSTDKLSTSDKPVNFPTILSLSERQIKHVVSEVTNSVCKYQQPSFSTLEKPGRQEPEKRIEHLEIQEAIQVDSSEVLEIVKDKEKDEVALAKPLSQLGAQTDGIESGIRVHKEFFKSNCKEDQKNTFRGPSKNQEESYFNKNHDLTGSRKMNKNSDGQLDSSRMKKESHSESKSSTEEPQISAVMLLKGADIPPSLSSTFKHGIDEKLPKTMDSVGEDLHIQTSVAHSNVVRIRGTETVQMSHAEESMPLFLWKEPMLQTVPSESQLSENVFRKNGDAIGGRKSPQDKRSEEDDEDKSSLLEHPKETSMWSTLLSTILNVQPLLMSSHNSGETKSEESSCFENGTLSESDSILTWSLLEVYRCLYQPVQLSISQMTHQLEESEACRQGLLDLVTRLDRQDQLRTESKQRKDNRWNTVLLEASTSVEVKKVQLQKVTQYHQQIQDLEGLLVCQETKLNELNLGSFESSTLLVEKLSDFLNNLQKKRGMIEDLLQTCSQVSSYLCEAEGPVTCIEPIRTLQERWQKLEYAASMRLWHANICTTEVSMLLQEARELQSELELLEKSPILLHQSQGHMDLQIQEIIRNADFGVLSEHYKYLLGISDGLSSSQIGKKELKDVEETMQSLDSQLALTKQKLFSQTLNLSDCSPVIGTVNDYITWVKQTEGKVTWRRTLSLFPEGASHQVNCMKKLHSEATTKRFQLTSTLKELRQELDEENSKAMLLTFDTLEGLYIKITEKTECAVVQMNRTLHSRDRLWKQITDISSWLTSVLEKESAGSKSTIPESKVQLSVCTETLKESETHANNLDTLLGEIKVSNNSLSLPESVRLIDRLTALQDEVSRVVNRVWAAKWILEELLHSQESSAKDLNVIQKRLRQMSADVSSMKYPVTSDSLSTLEPIKQILVKFLFKVTKVEPQRREIMKAIQDLQSTIQQLESRAKEHEEFFSLRQQVECSKEAVMKSIPQIVDSSLGTGVRLCICHSVLSELPLVRSTTQEAADHLEAISKDLHPSLLLTERQKIHLVIEQLASLKLKVKQEVKIFECSLVESVGDLTGLGPPTELFRSVRLRLKENICLEPRSNCIDAELQKHWMMIQTVESGLRILEGCMKGKEDEGYLVTMELGRGTLDDCHAHVDKLLQAKEVLKTYHREVQSAESFLKQIETSLLTYSTGIKSYKAEHRCIQELYSTLAEGFPQCLSKVGACVPQQTCFSISQTKQLHIEALSRLLVQDAKLEAQAQIRLEALQRCMRDQMKHMSHHDEISQLLKNIDLRISQHLSHKPTDVEGFQEQQLKLKVLVTDLKSIAKRLKELRESCPDARCDAPRDQTLGHLWRSWGVLQYRVESLKSCTTYRESEWRDVSIQLSKSKKAFERLQNVLPDSSMLMGSLVDLQRVLSLTEELQNEIDLEHHTLASLQRHVAQILGVTHVQQLKESPQSCQDLQLLQASCRGLRDQTNIIRDSVLLEIQDLGHLQEEMGSIQQSLLTLFMGLQSESAAEHLQDFKVQLMSQKSRVEDVVDRLGLVMESSGLLGKMPERLGEVVVGLNCVQELLKLTSPDLPEAEHTQKRVWDELDQWHTRLAELEAEVQDLGEQQPERAHNLMEQLTEPLQLYHSTAKHAEHRTALISKIPSCLQDFEALFTSTNFWLKEAESWLLAPRSYTTAKCLHCHASSLKMTLDESEGYRAALEAFLPTLQEISPVCDSTTLQQQLHQGVQSIVVLQRNILDPLNHLQHLAAEMDAIEAEVKTMEKNVAKIRTILSTTDAEYITPEEHLENLQVILGNVESMKKTIEEIERCRLGLGLPADAEQTLTAFHHAQDLLTPIQELQRLSEERSAALMAFIAESAESIVAPDPADVEMYLESSYAEEDDEDNQSSSSGTLTCSVPEEFTGEDAEFSSSLKANQDTDMCSLDSSMKLGVDSRQLSECSGNLLSIPSEHFEEFANNGVLKSDATYRSEELRNECSETNLTEELPSNLQLEPEISRLKDKEQFKDENRETSASMKEKESRSSEISSNESVAAIVHTESWTTEIMESEAVHIKDGIQTETKPTNATAPLDGTGSTKQDPTLETQREPREAIIQQRIYLTQEDSTPLRSSVCEDGGAEDSESLAQIVSSVKSRGLLVSESMLNTRETSSTRLLEDFSSIKGDMWTLALNRWRSAGHNFAIHQRSFQALLNGLRGLHELGSERLLRCQTEPPQKYSCLLTGHKKYFQDVGQSLEMVKLLYPQLPEGAVQGQAEVEQLLSDLLQQAQRQGIHMQHSSEEWKRLEKISEKLCKQLDQLQTDMLRVTVELDGDLQASLEEYQKFSKVLEDMSPEMWVLQKTDLGQGQTFPSSPLKIRWKKLHDQLQQKIHTTQKLKNTYERFQLYSAELEEWMKQARERLQQWTESSNSDPLLYSKLVEFFKGLEVHSTQKVSAERAGTQVLQLSDSEAVGLRRGLARLEQEWTNLTDMLPKLQLTIKQLFQGLSESQLSDNLSSWLEHAGRQLEDGLEGFQSALDSSELFRHVQTLKAVKAEVTSHQSLLDSMKHQNHIKCSEGIHFAEKLVAFEQDLLILQARIDFAEIEEWVQRKSSELKSFGVLRLLGQQDGEHPGDQAFSIQLSSALQECQALSQEINTLKSDFQPVKETLAQVESKMAAAELQTSAVIYKLELLRVPVLSSKQCQHHLECLQELDKELNQSDKNLCLSEFVCDFNEMLEPSALKVLEDRLKKEKTRQLAVSVDLHENLLKKQNELQLWLEYEHLSEMCRAILNQCWDSLIQLMHPPDTEENTVKLLNGRMLGFSDLEKDITALQSSLGKVLEASKLLTLELCPQSAPLIRSETRLVSREHVHLGKALCVVKAEAQEELEERSCFTTELKYLEKQLKNFESIMSSSSLSTERLKMVLLDLNGLNPNLAGLNQRSLRLSLNPEEEERLQILNTQWSQIYIELLHGQNFQQKWQSWMELQEKIESVLSNQTLGSSAVINKLLAEHQRLNVDILVGQQLQDAMIHEASCFLESSLDEGRLNQLKTGWQGSKQRVDKHGEFLMKLMRQWQLYEDGLRKLSRLFRHIEELLPPAGLAPCSLQQLQCSIKDFEWTEEQLQLHEELYEQTLEAGEQIFHLTDVLTQKRLKNELETLKERWERSCGIVGKRKALAETITQNWKLCETGLTNGALQLEEINSRLKRSLPKKIEDLKTQEQLTQEDEDLLQIWAGGLKELSTMKADVSQYVLPADTALLQGQVEELHSQWEELCLKVSLRKQEIADRLNAWIIFNHKNRELCDWLTQMEKKVSHRAENLSIEEMVEKLKKDCMEEINLFSENKSHLKQLGEQLLMASDKAKEAEIHGALHHVNDRWQSLFDHIEASICHRDEIQKRLAEQQELQRDIEQHTERVASVLTLCEVLLHDEDACSSDGENDSIQQTTQRLDLRWRNICSMSLERRLRIEETWRLWCKFQEDYSAFMEWLSAAECTAAEPNSSDVLYTDAKEELQKYEVFQRRLHESLTQLEMVNNQYRRLARENRTDAASRLRTMVHQGNQRWDTLQRRVAAILRRLRHFTSQREEFEGTRESLLVWLTEIDLQLTNMEHFSESHLHDKMKQLKSFKKEITLNTNKIDALIVFGEGLIQRSAPLDAVEIEEELEEMHTYCQEVFGRVARFHQRLSILRPLLEQTEVTDGDRETPREIHSTLSSSQPSMCLLALPKERSGRETPVSVDSIPLEWDHTGQNWHFHSMSERKPLSLEALSPADTSTPLKQGYIQLMSECSGSINSVKRVSMILDDDELQEEQGLTGLKSADSQSGVIERWELLQAQAVSKEQGSSRDSQQLTSDLDDITSWLERISIQMDGLQGPETAASVQVLENRVKQLKEMQKTFAQYKTVLLSLNLCGRELLEADLQESLRTLNNRWTDACGALERLEESLRSTLERCQEFHETVHSLLLWLAHAESRLSAFRVNEASLQPSSLQEQTNTLKELSEDLLNRQEQTSALQAIVSELLPETAGDDHTEAREKLHVIASKLRLLSRQVQQDLQNLPQTTEFTSEASSDTKSSECSRSGRELSSSGQRSFFRRVLRAAFPLHLLFLLFLLLACLLPVSDEHNSCALANNFQRSFHPMLRYTNGPPPT
ncbi:hypothetical protein DNTS_013096, partial [Danionella cerebrum]